MLLRYARTFTGFERDARLFLLATVVSAAAISLWWVDFNLYLRALGLSTALIGLVATVGSAAGLVTAFPASLLSDRVGRRLVMLLGGGLALVAFLTLLLTSQLAALFFAAACFSAGTGAVTVVSSPFMTEHSSPDRRNELFSAQFAIGSGMNVVGALVGGLVAAAVAQWAGFDAQGPEAYRVLILMMAILGALSLLALARLGDDRPRRGGAASAPIAAASAGRAAPSAPPGGDAEARDAPTLELSPEPEQPLVEYVPPSRRQPAAGEHRQAGGGRRLAGDDGRRAGRSGRSFPIRDRAGFVRLVLPGFLISLGAGQVIPFLNIYIERKFGLQLAGLNILFAISNLGTMFAVLLQPALARRMGKIGSVVFVQGVSIPFLLVLGFSPAFWTVAVALTVRNALMNAGNPIFNAFAMERVSAGERATLSATMSVLWSLGWVIAGPWYSFLQARLGFDAGYAVNFITVITLYSVATLLYWVWFGRAERAKIRGAAPALP